MLSYYFSLTLHKIICTICCIYFGDCRILFLCVVSFCFPSIVFGFALIPLCLWLTDSPDRSWFYYNVKQYGSATTFTCQLSVSVSASHVYAYVIFMCSRCRCRSHCNPSPFIDVIKLLDGKIRIFAIKWRIFYCVFYVIFLSLSLVHFLFKSVPQMW